MCAQSLAEGFFSHSHYARIPMVKYWHRSRTAWNIENPASYPVGGPSFLNARINGLIPR
jgi:hypothetical protein